MYSALLAGTVPTELKFYGSKLTETNGKRITGDEVTTVHNFKLSSNGWDISYRPESVGAFLGFSDWCRLYYKGLDKGKDNNGKPKYIKYYPSKEEMFKYKSVRWDSESHNFYVDMPNPEYQEFNYEYKTFNGTYKNLEVELRIFSDGSTYFITDDGKFRIAQELLGSSSYDSEKTSFMTGIYNNNK